MDRDYSVVKLEGVRLMFKNFKGEVRNQYDKAGSHTFSILLDEGMANELITRGFNVKPLRALDEYQEPAWHLPVEASWRIKSPSVWLISSKGKKLLKEDDVKILDTAEITNCDVYVEPSYWSRPDGSSGVKAYLHSLYATIYENELDNKYADIPEIS